jgi:hypothetical protein
MQLKNPTALKDTLHNLASDSGASTDYCTGIVVGVVGALMATGKSYSDAISIVAANFPAKHYNPRIAVPESWVPDLMTELAAMWK